MRRARKTSAAMSSGHRLDRARHVQPGLLTVGECSRRKTRGGPNLFDRTAATPEERSSRRTATRFLGGRARGRCSFPEFAAWHGRNRPPAEGAQSRRPRWIVCRPIMVAELTASFQPAPLSVAAVQYLLTTLPNTRVSGGRVLASRRWHWDSAVHNSRQGATTGGSCVMHHCRASGRRFHRAAMSGSSPELRRDPRSRSCIPQFITGTRLSAEAPVTIATVGTVLWGGAGGRFEPSDGSWSAAPSSCNRADPSLRPC